MAIVILRGLPASGKSSYASDAIKYIDGFAVVSRDAIRMSLFGRYDNVDENLITKVEDNMVAELVKSGRDVIIDSMNLRPSYIKRWYKYGRPIIKEFPISLDEAIKRDSERLCKAVGEDVIRKLYDKYMPKGEFLPVPDYDKWIEEQHGKTSLFKKANNFAMETYGIKSAIIVDIDGTIAEMNGRSPYDYSKVSEDLPRDEVINIVKSIQYDENFSKYVRYVIFVSGRPDSCREDTEKWLTEHFGNYHELHMRKTGDTRNDAVVKYEIYKEHIEPNYYVEAVFDDRLRVCRMWHEIGLPLFKVGDPDADF